MKRYPKHHLFKTFSGDFQAVKCGDKKAELRDLSDRKHVPCAGDLVTLIELDHADEETITGQWLIALVTHIREGEQWLKPDCAMLSIKLIQHGHFNDPQCGAAFKE